MKVEVVDVERDGELGRSVELKKWDGLRCGRGGGEVDGCWGTSLLFVLKN